MAAKLNFFRWLATSVAALGVMSVIGGTGLAQSTWVGASGTAGQAWNTASNWTGGVPVSSGTANFNATASNYTLRIGTTASPLSSNPLSRVNVANTSGATAYQISAGTLVLADNGVINNSRRTSAGASGFTVTNISLSGSASVGGTGYTTLSNVFGTGPLNLTSGTTRVGTSEVAISTGTSATLVVSDSALGVVDVASGGTLTTVANTYGTNTYDSLSLASGATTVAYVGYVDDVTMASDTYSGSITYGGNLNLNFGGTGGMLGNLVESWTGTNIFAGAKSGSFNSVTLSNAAAPYTGLTFNRVGTEWVTGTFAGFNGETQWLVFSETNGSLVVVPEPSTIVFAGVGVAMAGWSAWKKRRLSKVLAKS